VLAAAKAKPDQKKEQKLEPKVAAKAETNVTNKSTSVLPEAAAAPLLASRVRNPITPEMKEMFKEGKNKEDKNTATLTSLAATICSRLNETKRKAMKLCQMTHFVGLQNSTVEQNATLKVVGNVTQAAGTNATKPEKEATAPVRASRLKDPITPEMKQVFKESAQKEDKNTAALASMASMICGKVSEAKRKSMKLCQIKHFVGLQASKAQPNATKANATKVLPAKETAANATKVLPAKETAANVSASKLKDPITPAVKKEFEESKATEDKNTAALTSIAKVICGKASEAQRKSMKLCQMKHFVGLQASTAQPNATKTNVTNVLPAKETAANVSASKLKDPTSPEVKKEFEESRANEDKNTAALTSMARVICGKVSQAKRKAMKLCQMKTFVGLQAK